MNLRSALFPFSLLAAGVLALAVLVTSRSAVGVIPPAPDVTLSSTTHRVVVQRSAVNDALSDVGSVQKQGRALLHRDRHGNFDGYRLSGILHGGLPARVGFENGDVVHSIDGHRLTSVQDAMEAYQALMHATQFRVHLTRNGEPRVIDIEVADS